MVTAAADSASTLGTVYDDVQCKVQIPGLDPASVRVAAFSGNERLSTLFAYTIDVATSPDDVGSLESALGADVSFVIERDGEFERGVFGILTAVAPDGTYMGANQVRTTLLLEPRLANLRYSGGFRIFQKMSIKDIVASLLSPERIDVVWRLRPDPPERDYRTQFNESDFSFIARLAADEGVHFFFESTADKTSLVFTNNPKGFLAIDGASTLPYRGVGGAVSTEHVRTIQRERRVRTGAVEHRDYDFTNPRVALVGRAEIGGAQSEANTTRREWRDYPGGFTDPDGEGTSRARMRLDELRADASVWTGTASTNRLIAGKRFALSEHADSDYNGDLIVTDVTLSGGIEGAFDEGGGGRSPRAVPSILRFSAVPAETPLRPRRLDKPASRLQTARVVGPTDGDPNVDDYGRINVQFAWDREGKFDANSSCWIRMATPSAHGNEGFWMAHRVGAEVLVDFIDGDIDRPVVVGALYNGLETQPYAQPGGVTRSTWKTRGIPGGSGFNEITFENSTGNEQIILHAQKDLNETILNDHSETIGTNQSSAIGSNQSITVGVDRSLSVGNNETINVGANQSITIGANQSTTIGANQTDAVGASRTTTVASNDTTTVMGSATKMVAQADTVLVGAARSLTAASEAVTVGSRVKTVAGDETTSVGGGRTESVGGDETIAVGGQRGTSVTNDDTLGVGKTFAITAGEQYVLKVGDDATLTLTKDGDIELKTGEATLSMSKDGTIALKGKSVSVEASSDLSVKGDDVAIKGSKVAVN